MTASDDEYDTQAGGPIQLTEQDCVRIDALCGVDSRDYSHSFNVPHIDIVLDTNITRQASVPASVERPSLIERFRPSGRLSVSDLVSPAWCEVQFEYGLLQRRSWRLDRRPGTFMSREGNEIRVDQTTAQRNDIMLQEGHAVHFALEREVHPDKVEVTTTTMEEHWGLRLFNMISDLQTLVLVGKCREFRVMGFIHDHFVTGIIDEINRVLTLEHPSSSVPHKKRTRDLSTPSTPNKPKPKRTRSSKVPSSLDKQLGINSFFPTTPGTFSRVVEGLLDTDDMPSTESLTVPGDNGTAEPSPLGTHVLRLIDSKTRLSPSLPDQSATLSSRLQLMMYKRLLDALLTPLPPFDFTKLWKHLGLDSGRGFSEAFMKQVLPLNPAKGIQATCLKELEKCWWSTVQELGVGVVWDEREGESSTPIDPELTLVYRLRGAGSRRKGKRKVESHSTIPSSKSTDTSEQEDLQKAITESLHEAGRVQEEDLQDAILESLREVRRGQHDGDTQLGHAVEGVASESREPGVSTEMTAGVSVIESRREHEAMLDPKLGRAAGESLRGIPDDVSQSSGNSFVAGDTHEPDGPPKPLKSGDIIGQKTFKHDDVMLDAHLNSILAWWHGEREPRGVEIEESNRCHTCEYIEGCEWRERKALEARESSLVVEKSDGLTQSTPAYVSQRVGKLISQRANSQQGSEP